MIAGNPCTFISLLGEIKQSSIKFPPLEIRIMCSGIMFHLIHELLHFQDFLPQITFHIIQTANIPYICVFAGIKDYSNWPTIPQVYLNGEFLGGCDIMIEMHQNGDLIEELNKIGIRSALLDKPKDPQ